MTEDDINVNKVDFWHHLLNKWIGGVVLKLVQHLAELLSNDLKVILFMLRVTTNLTNLGRATKKYLRLQTKCVKAS